MIPTTAGKSGSILKSMFEELLPKKHPQQEAVDSGFKKKEEELEAWLIEMKSKNNAQKRAPRERSHFEDEAPPSLL